MRRRHRTTTFVVVGTESSELDYEGATEIKHYVQATGASRSATSCSASMFAWRYSDVNLLTSGQISVDSRILINRDIRDPGAEGRAVPLFDADPYWPWSTADRSGSGTRTRVTNEFPYWESIDVGVATDGELMPGEINYMRNSVKVVIDAYDGTMTYYADLQEPIVAAWASVFPDLFTDIGTASEDLRAHFRYPENLFQVQAEHYANYHVTEPDVFYQKQDFWQVPADPTARGRSPSADGSYRPRRTRHAAAAPPGLHAVASPRPDGGIVPARDPFVPEAGTTWSRGSRRPRIRRTTGA